MLARLRSFVLRVKPALPALILGIGAILRIAGTGSSAIWFDESNTVYRGHIPFMTLFTEHSERSGDLFLELLLRPLLAISDSVWMLRLPSMVAGLISLWLVWKLMRRLSFTLPQQIYASALVACLPGLLWMAQDGRSYSLVTCLFLAALWFALESQWLGLLAVCGLLIYTHSTAAVYAATALLIALYLYPWKVRRIFLVGVLVAISWIPAIYRMSDYFIVQQPWQPVLTLDWFLFATVQTIWPMPWPGYFALYCSATLLVTLFLFASRIRARGRIVLLLAWLVPYLLLILYCLVLKSNVINYRTLMPIILPFAMWLGWELGTRRLLVHLPRLAWIWMLLLGLVLYDPAYRGARLDQVANYIRSQWRTGDTLVYTTVTTGLPFDYYLSDLPHTWSPIVTEPYFLGISTITHTELPTPTGDVSRSWVVIPYEKVLITPDEWTELDDLVHHQPPHLRMVYVQTASIDIYLVEEP